MNEVLLTVGQVLARTVMVVLGLLQFALLIRAVLSWFTDEDNKISAFMTFITEPVILPFRKLFYKMNWFQSTPMDVPFLAAVLFLWLLELILGFVSF
ncbi:MAG: YggT family protein [Clostridia bacterium]|nr:YggT family protein [Clostridia bacterium]